jgi:hypothetical protein
VLGALRLRQTIQRQMADLSALIGQDELSIEEIDG